MFIFRVMLVYKGTLPSHATVRDKQASFMNHFRVMTHRCSISKYCYSFNIVIKADKSTAYKSMNLSRQNHIDFSLNSFLVRFVCFHRHWAVRRTNCLWM